MGEIPHSDGEICGVILSSMKIDQKNTFLTFSRKGNIHLKKKHGLVDRSMIGLGIVLGIGLLVTLTGCIGFVGGDGGYVGGGWWGDDGGWWGGGGRGYDRGHDVHVYSVRGAASRGAAHGGGGHGGGGGKR